MKARVYVTLKPGVLDTQGRAVQKTLGALGFNEVAGVRIGKYVEVELDPKAPADHAAIRERLVAMCDKLLANPVIEDYRIDLADPASGEPHESDAPGPRGARRKSPPKSREKSPR